MVLDPEIELVGRHFKNHFATPGICRLRIGDVQCDLHVQYGSLQLSSSRAEEQFVWPHPAGRRFSQPFHSLKMAAGDGNLVARFIVSSFTSESS
jgi:hypothetical protein